MAYVVICEDSSITAAPPRGEAGKENGRRLLYTGAVFRFVGVLVALLLAYGLGLHLLAVAGGMLLAQIALFAYAASHPTAM